MNLNDLIELMDGKTVYKGLSKSYYEEWTPATQALAEDDLSELAKQLEAAAVPTFTVAEESTVATISAETLRMIEESAAPVIVFDPTLRLWRALELGEYRRSDAFAKTFETEWSNAVRARIASGLDCEPLPLP